MTVLKDVLPADIPVGKPNVFTVSDVKNYYPDWLDRVATLKKTDNGVLYEVVWNED